MALAGGGFEPTAFAAAGLVVWIAVVIGLAVGVAAALAAADRGPGRRDLRSPGSPR